MNFPDLINGLFELGGSVVLWLNVVQTYRDKGYRGVTAASTFFFSAWGYWNLYYYPSLNQWVSFFAGISIVAANTTWFGLMLYYGHTELRKSA
jgi:hypothetical protein